MANDDDASILSAGAIGLSRGFIDNKAASLHDAFGVESHFNMVMSKYQPKDISDLEETLEQFQKQAPHQADFSYNLLHCTWHDVFEELEKTYAAVSESNKRGKKLHRRAWRATGALSDLLTPGLVAIPNNLSAVQGGLAVIFSLARQRFQDRQKLLRTFEDIPNVIMMAYGKAETIPRNRPRSIMLHEMVSDLQKTLLYTLPILIEKLNPGTFLAKARSPFKNFDIDDLIAAIHSKSERVRICAEGELDSMIVSAHQTIDDNHKVSNVIYSISQEIRGELVSAHQTIDDNHKLSKDILTVTQETTEEVASVHQTINNNQKMSDDIYSITQETKEEVVSTHQAINDHRKMSEDIHMITRQTGEGVEDIQGKIDEILKHQKAFQATLDAVSGKNGLLSFIMEHLKEPKRQDEEMSSIDTLPIYEPATPLTARQLLAMMNVRHLTAIEDEQHIIRRGHTLDREAISHAASMLTTTQVQQLLHSQDSGVVLVNGCSDRSQNTKISPITHVCATLTHALRRSDSANIVLAFFCGQHQTPKDDLEGPQGLMRSLIAHLLLIMIQNECISELTPIWVPASEEDFEKLSFENICQLFYHLFEHVPKRITVYCVVDGISYYERDMWKKDYDLMMECFSSIIANEAITAVFKLLLTSPTMSRWLPDLAPDQRVSLRNTRVRGSTNPERILHLAGL